MTTQPLTPAGLRCAHKVNPIGVAPDRVRLSWVLEGAGTGRAQRAYQVLVTPDDCRPNSGDDPYWDSGRIESSASADIVYAGLPLAAGGRYRWKVRVWDEAGLVSGWSEPGWFEVELDRTDGWHASWIGLGRFRGNVTPPAQAGPPDPVAKALNPAPYLRRAFTVDQPVAGARLYVTALGLYEARLNGRRVGDAVLAPGWTDYARRIPYQTYDVTGLLAEGDNVLGAILADGWYSGFYGFDAKRAGAHYGTAPELLAQLDITYADGSRGWIVTDEQWRSADGAIRHADLLMGERHDLALEPARWDAPGFDASGWRPVRVRDRDATPLVADPGPPVRVTQELAPYRLAAAIRTAGWHLTTGFVGVGYILPVLSAHGHADVAYRLLEQDSPPSWRYMVEAGATTIWERWDGWTAERGFQSAWMNSFNHYALGSVGEWLHRFVLGTDQAPGTAGFGQLLLRPYPGGSLSWARGSYRSVRGPISTGWKQVGDRFTFWAELPPNVSASVRIPSDRADEVRDAAGNPPAALASFPGAREAHEAVFQISSGAHEFSGPTMTGPQTPPGIPSKEELGVRAPASGRRPCKQLVDEDVLQPLFVPLGGPASVTDEQPVYLGGHECVNDVRSVALAQLRP